MSGNTPRQSSDLRLSMAEAVNCDECGGTKFTDHDGCKVCSACGTLLENYLELETQEYLSELDRSRLSRVKKQRIPTDVEGTSNPTASDVETYNYILREWTKALRGLGASSDFEKVILEVWILYLQKMELAFLHEDEEVKYLANSKKIVVTTLLNNSYPYSVSLSADEDKKLASKISKATPKFDCFPLIKARLELRQNWGIILLSLLYLAILLAEEPILLMDIIRWCMEGHIPFLSAHNLLGEDHDCHSTSRYNSKHMIPTASEIKDIAESLALLMNIIYLPAPPMKPIMDRLIKLLRLPEYVGSSALKHLKKLSESQSCIIVIGMELYAMGAIIMVLKEHFGVNDVDEIHLSIAARIFNKELETKHTPFFCWEDWERYINKLLVFCGEIDPVTRMNCRTRQDFVKIDSKVYSKYLWSECVWQASTKLIEGPKGKKAASISEKLLRAKNTSLEEVLNEPADFQATMEPFFSVLEQFIEAKAKDPNYDQEVKTSKELLQNEFASMALFPSLKNLKKVLEENGSEIHIRTSREGKRREQDYVYVPQPHKRVSKLYYKEEKCTLANTIPPAVRLLRESDSFQWNRYRPASVTILMLQ